MYGEWLETQETQELNYLTIFLLKKAKGIVRQWLTLRLTELK